MRSACWEKAVGGCVAEGVKGGRGGDNGSQAMVEFLFCQNSACFPSTLRPGPA